jgi:pimeloyl-ACP methyl ester carboxylesterase
MKQETRFCTTPDNVRIAYAITGKGPPIVKAANYLSHLDFDWQSPVWRHFLDTLSTDSTLIRYDERGCGLSDWDPLDFSFDAWVRDLETVVEAAGVDRFPLLGISQGGAVAIEYAVRHPEKVTHLIVYGGYARGWGKRGSEKIVEERRASMTLTKHGWGRDDPAIRQYFTSKFLPDGTIEQMRWFNDLQRVSCSPENAIRFQEVFGTVDVSVALPQVKAPTLVIHSRGDLSVPFEEGRIVAAGIPNSRLVALESRNHVLLETDPAWQRFVSEVRNFLGKNDLVSSVVGKPGRKTGLGISGWIKGPET